MFMKNNFYFDLFFTLSGISYFPFLLGTGFSKAYCVWPEIFGIFILGRLLLAGERMGEGCVLGEWAGKSIIMSICLFYYHCYHHCLFFFFPLPFFLFMGHFLLQDFGVGE